MQGNNIVVVGGSRGIGFGIVQRLLARGASVTVISRTRGELSDSTQVRHILADMANSDAPLEGLPEVVDGLVYCPGTINLGPVRSVDCKVLREDFEVNVVGAVRSLQAAQTALKKSPAASVVLFSTVAVQTGFAMHTNVSAVKGALEGLTRTWANELAPKVRVNCIAPALTNTDLASRLLATEEKRKAMANIYPLKRYGEVDDIAAMAEFLLSDASSWMTGQILHVDGGASSVHG